MDLKISTEEIRALVLCHPEVRYQYTLKRIADTECMWSVTGSKDSSFVVQNYEDKRLFSKMLVVEACPTVTNSNEHVAVGMLLYWK